MSRVSLLRRWMDALRGRGGQAALPHIARLLPIDEAGRPHAETVERLAFSADGARVISACARTVSLRVWEARDGRNLDGLDAPAGAGDLVGWQPSHDVRRCVTTHAGDPWTLHVWDLEHHACSAPLSGVRGERLSHLALDPRGERAVVLSYEQPLMDPDFKHWRLSVLGLDEPARMRTFLAMEETYSVGSVALHPDGVRAFVATNGVVEVWDLDQARCVAILEGCGASPELVLDSEGARCVVGMREGRVRVWDTTTSERCADLDVATRYALVRFLPDEARALVVGHELPPRVWDLQRGVALHAIGDSSLRRDRFAVDRSGSLAVIDDGDRALAVWDVVRGVLLARATLEGRPSALAIGRDGSGVVRVAIGAGPRVCLIELV